MKWGNPYLVHEVTVYPGKQRKLRAPNSSDRPIHGDSISTNSNRQYLSSDQLTPGRLYSCLFDQEYSYQSTVYYTLFDSWLTIPILLVVCLCCFLLLDTLVLALGI